MGIHFDPRGETVTIHRKTFLALTAATSIDTSAIRGCVGAIDRLARDVPLGTEARQSLNDYASIQTSIDTGAPDVLGQFLGLNEVVLTGSQDTSTHQGRFQIVTLTLRYAIDDNHTRAETIPVILALQGSHIQNIIIPSADDIGTLPEPLRQAILAPQKDIHRGEPPDPAPSTAELHEMEARTNPALSERSAGNQAAPKQPHTPTNTGRTTTAPVAALMARDGEETARTSSLNAWRHLVGDTPGT